MSVSSGESDVRKFEPSPLIHTSPNVPSSTSRMRCVMAEKIQILRRGRGAEEVALHAGRIEVSGWAKHDNENQV